MIDQANPSELLEEIPALAPLDEHNQALLANAHPPDWVNPEPRGCYNLVVIGGGTAGLVTASGAAGLGARVALIEKHLLGGDCLNVGCVPSKAIIRSARVAADVRAAGAFGVRVTGEIGVDFQAVMERMRRIRAGISPHDSARRFREMGIDVFIGPARFTGRNRLEVDAKRLEFARACIATGGRAVVPPIPGLKEAGYLTNETVFSLTELPRRLAVIGAGPVGCELAQTFARFGSQVTLIEAEKQILIHEDDDAARRVQVALVRDGVNIICGGRAAQVTTRGDEKLMRLECDGETHDLTVDAILVGVGRAPNVEGLDLEAAGVAYDKHGVKVNDFLQTSNKNIYAAGDICTPYKFTHMADALARIVIQNALFFGRAKASSLTIPWCTYTDPEIAHVGLYEKDAEQNGLKVKTITVELSGVDRAVLDGQSEGFLKVHLKDGSDSILGATLVASHAGEMISELTLAIVAKVGLRTLGKAIHPYPTQAEVIRKAADAFSRSRLTPWLKRVFEKLLSWRR